MIESILDRMTLEEQVSLLSGADFWTTVAIDRLGVPKVKVTDGPNGARGAGSLVGGVEAACYPVGIALGATWNPELVRRMGASLAGQAKSKGASILLAPTINIHRSGLNGRNFECYSEDPHLTGELAVAYVQGVQSEGIAATVKHFAGNESEVERQTMSSDIDERTLREIYLAPFEQTVRRGKAMAFMSAYNKLNGVYSSENDWLLTQVLREEWGFDGVVMSDWFGSRTTAETINAGLDLEMPGPTRDRGDKLVAAVRDGKVKPENIREAARRMLVLLERVGAFETPPDLNERFLDREEDRTLIRQLGSEGAVLLKNNGVLPLEMTSLARIAVLGPNAATARIMGGGSAQIATSYAISPLQGIQAALQNPNSMQHAVGCRHNRLVELLQADIHVEFFAGHGREGTPLHIEKAVKGEFFWFDLPEKRLDPTNFSVRLSTTFTPDETGEHVFGMTNAGLARLYIDDTLLIDGNDGWTKGENYFGTANDEIRASVTLEAGRRYNIRVDYDTPEANGEGIYITAVRFGVERPLGIDAIDEAVELARNSDVALVFVGRDGEWDTEGLDLPDLRLPGKQDELIRRIAAVNSKTVVVLQTGGPIEMPWLDDVAAVVQFWYPGQELGNAVADVLFGDVEPRGRLPQTFPRSLWDNSAMAGHPETYPGKDGHVRYEEGVFVGYRHHDARGVEPLFPFGYGLGYTEFNWSQPTVSSREFGSEGISVTVDIQNVGSRSGSEVVQLYIRSPKGKVERPDKELRAFAKMFIPAGQTGTTTLAIKPRDLCYYDVDLSAFHAEPGTYEILLAANASDIRSVTQITLSHAYILPPEA
ncbi:glycoside hydrolase family 3 C-terminal domain-containing protein [Rhizobium sp. G187]|uniref:beta-glucosidase n=1 Tax=Rhizobium sp. G187 TaxID=3451352 RepID=UPI003EE5FDCC